MRKSLIITLVASVYVLLGMTSCNKEMYDEKKYRELIHYNSAVDSVDQQHMWQLSEVKSLRFEVPSGSKYTQLHFYTGNPLKKDTVELMNRLDVTEGQKGILSLSVPYLQDSIYAALVDASGNYTVTSVLASQGNVSFASATTGRPVAIIRNQSYTYLFEENFPEPSNDYDYNDVVLRIALERTARNQITIHVTLAAVGAAKQIAGCLRLDGYGYGAIDSVYTISGKTFNDGIAKNSYYFYDKTDNLVAGRNNEAVINLFCDAHQSMMFKVSAGNGILERKKYNVSNQSSETYQITDEPIASYVVTFKEEYVSSLNYFTLDNLDPFILTEYNSGIFETHLERFKEVQAIKDYFVDTTFKDLPWALMVPQSDFHYPLEGQSIGYRKRTEDGIVALMGAYTELGHSFGEWAEDHTRFYDWYLHPNIKMTY